MGARSQRQKEQERTLSSLNVAIEATNLAKEASGVTPAKPILILIRQGPPHNDQGMFYSSAAGCSRFGPLKDSTANKLD